MKHHPSNFKWMTLSLQRESTDLWQCLTVLSFAWCFKESPRTVFMVPGWPKDAAGKIRQSSTHEAPAFGGSRRSWRREPVVRRRYVEKPGFRWGFSLNDPVSWICQHLRIARGLCRGVDVLTRNWKDQCEPWLQTYLIPAESQESVPLRLSLVCSLLCCFHRWGDSPWVIVKRPPSSFGLALSW